MNKSYTNLKKVSGKNGEIEYQAEIPVEVLQHGMMEELAEIAEDFSLPGFRKGKVPHNVVREHVSDMDLVEGAANSALRDAMQEIVADEKINVLGRPQITIMKIAPGNPVEFKIRYALTPEITLPDYKKIGRNIAEREHPFEVTDKEVDEALVRIQSMIMPQGAKDTDGGAGAKMEINDENVKQFGPFKDVAAFKEELKKNLLQEKQLHAKDGDREEIVKEVVKAAKVKVPELLIEQELFEFIQDRDQQLKDAGLSLEEYLKQIKKTPEQLEKDERTLIETDIRTSLIIQEIRRKENITADERDVQIGIARLKLRYPERDEASLRATSEALIVQEKLFALLEGTPSQAPLTKEEAEATFAHATVEHPEESEDTTEQTQSEAK